MPEAGSVSFTSPSARVGRPVSRRSGNAAVRRLAHGQPERVERTFSLSHRHIRSVTQLMALLHQVSRRLARHLRPASYCHWKHRAAVEVRPDTVGQVCVAPRAPV
jgi:hypothetical protein